MIFPCVGEDEETENVPTGEAWAIRQSLKHDSPTHLAQAFFQQPLQCGPSLHLSPQLVLLQE
jgi:hypothetical protein